MDVDVEVDSEDVERRGGVEHQEVAEVFADVDIIIQGMVITQIITSRVTNLTIKILVFEDIEGLTTVDEVNQEEEALMTEHRR